MDSKPQNTMQTSRKLAVCKITSMLVLMACRLSWTGGGSAAAALIAEEKGHDGAKVVSRLISTHKTKL